MKHLNYFTQQGDQYILDIQKQRWTITTVVFIIGGIACFFFFDKFCGLLFLALGAFVSLRLTKKVVFDTAQRVVFHRNSILTGTEVLPFDNFENFSVTRTKEGISSITLNDDFEMYFDMGGRSRKVILRKTSGKMKFAEVLMDEVEWIMNQNTPNHV